LSVRPREGLLALSVGVGLGVMAELMEEEVCEVVGPNGKHDRSSVRHGHEASEVTLGGRRVAVERPRVRSADGSEEMALTTYQHFADRDPLTRLVLEQTVPQTSHAETAARLRCFRAGSTRSPPAPPPCRPPTARRPINAAA
jgi:hypothetical protein